MIFQVTRNLDQNNNFWTNVKVIDSFSHQKVNEGVTVWKCSRWHDSVYGTVSFCHALSKWVWIFPKANIKGYHTLSNAISIVSLLVIWWLAAAAQYKSWFHFESNSRLAKKPGFAETLTNVLSLYLSLLFFICKCTQDSERRLVIFSQSSQQLSIFEMRNVTRCLILGCRVGYYVY